MTIFWKLRHCGFNPIHSFPTDPMHNIFIGCVCSFVHFWFDSEFKLQAYSCHGFIDEVNAAIKEIQKQVPHEFSRPPRFLGKGFLTNTKGKFYFIIIYGTKWISYNRFFFFFFWFAFEKFLPLRYLNQYEPIPIYKPIPI